MIGLCRPDPSFPNALLERKGGFVWWYIDLVDAAGDGVVLIWSYGLPFLPGYRSAALRSQAEAPRDLPSLNVVIYRGGRAVFYSLERYRSDEATYEPEARRWTMGRSTMAMTECSGRLEVRVQLDVSIAASDDRLRGSLRVEGALREACLTDMPAASLPHGWTPLAPCAIGGFELTTRAERYAGHGAAYVDGNVGNGPFCSFGIAEWTWARATRNGQTRIVYLVNGHEGTQPIYLGAVAHDDGSFETVSLSVRSFRRRRDRWGVHYGTEIVTDSPSGPFATIVVRSIVDRGPFYLRMQVSMEFDGVRSDGWAEVVRPDRIDLARHRPLVRMRVADHTRRPSFWLPLFSGPVRGRFARLVGQLGRRRLLTTDAAAPRQEVSR